MLSLLFSRNPKPDLESLTSNPGLAIQGPKPTSTMDSLQLKSLRILLSWSQSLRSGAIPCSTFTTSQAPGEKNTVADDLSQGKLSSFSDDFRICFDLAVIFDNTPFPRYINPLVQWDPDIVLVSLDQVVVV